PRANGGRHLRRDSAMVAFQSARRSCVILPCGETSVFSNEWLDVNWPDAPRCLCADAPPTAEQDDPVSQVSPVSQTATAGTLSAHVLLRVVEFCRKRGADPERLCENAGTNLQHLRAPDARVPYETVARLGQLALDVTNEPDFGLQLAQDVQDPQNFDVGLLVMMASANVRAALNHFIDKQRYWGDGDRASLREVEDGVAIRYVLAGAQGDYARHSYECALAEMVLGVRTLTGQPLRPTLVRFPHAKPRSTAEHERIFACPLEFAAPAAELILGN